MSRKNYRNGFCLGKKEATVSVAYLADQKWGKGLRNKTSHKFETFGHRNTKPCVLALFSANVKFVVVYAFVHVLDCTMDGKGIVCSANSLYISDSIEVLVKTGDVSDSRFFHNFDY